MNIGQLLLYLAELISDLYDLMYNIFFYKIEIGSISLMVYQVIGYLGGAGLAAFVILKIVKSF